MSTAVVKTSASIGCGAFRPRVSGSRLVRVVPARHSGHIVAARQNRVSPTWTSQEGMVPHGKG